MTARVAKLVQKSKPAACHPRKFDKKQKNERLNAQRHQLPSIQQQPQQQQLEMGGADAARALAIAEDEIIYAVRLGCLFFACPKPCGQSANGERVFHWAARYWFH